MTSVIGSDTEVESDGGGKCTRQKNKPLMEKKRRARINRSLSQLKQILIQDEHKNSSQHSKWEKADILEMTVEYLQLLRASKLNSSSSTPTSSENSGTPMSFPNFPAPLMAFPMNPMMQQYMAFQQLTQLTMIQNMMGNTEQEKSKK